MLATSVSFHKMSVAAQTSSQLRCSTTAVQNTWCDLGLASNLKDSDVMLVTRSYCTVTGLCLRLLQQGLRQQEGCRAAVASDALESIAGNVTGIQQCLAGQALQPHAPQQPATMAADPNPVAGAAANKKAMTCSRLPNSHQLPIAGRQC